MTAETANGDTYLPTAEGPVGPVDGVDPGGGLLCGVLKGGAEGGAGRGQVRHANTKHRHKGPHLYVIVVEMMCV